MLFPYFVYIVHFTKFTHGISLEKSLLVEKSKVEGKKKKKQERKYHFVKKRKEKKRKSFEKATGTSGAPRWHPVRTEKSPSNQKLLYMMLKTRFPFSVCKYQSVQKY